MYKEIILSCIIHLVIIVTLGRELKKEAFTMEMAGDQVSVNMISIPKGNSTEDQIKKSLKEEIKKTEDRKEAEKPVEDKKEAKKIEKQDKKPEKVPEKPKKTEKKIVVESPQKEEISEEAVEEEQPETTVVEEAGSKAEESEETADEESEGSEANEKKGHVQGNPDTDDNLVRLTDGSLSVKHQGVKGLSYGFISKPDPGYPSVARRLGFDRELTVRVVMQFDGNGELESVKLMDERDRFGFATEVEKAVANWKLTPIEYRGRMVKMRFYKKFKFEVPR